MAIDFRVVPHSLIPSVKIVEILESGMVIGCICPEEEKSIRVVSAHFAESSTDEGFAGAVVEDDGSDSPLPIPAHIIRFEPSPWTIEGGRVVKSKTH